jgi:hypothetical protein
MVCDGSRSSAGENNNKAASEELLAGRDNKTRKESGECARV